jgi:hypothetical protein
MVENINSSENSPIKSKLIHRLDDSKRIQSVLEEVTSTKNMTNNPNSSSKSNNNMNGYTMEAKAKELVMKRAEEITKSVIL